jgi:hypothetical protein
MSCCRFGVGATCECSLWDCWVSVEDCRAEVMTLEMMHEAVLARTCCHLRPWLAIRTPPQIFGYQGAQGLDLVETNLGHQPKAGQGAWTAGELVTKVFGSSRDQKT